MKQVIVTPNAPAAIGPYSQGIAAGQTVYVSGQLPIDPATGLIPEGIAAQTAQSLKNIQAILAQQEMTLANVVKTTVFLADINDFAEMNKVYGEYFAQPYPARSAVQVGKLPKDAPLELESLRTIRKSRYKSTAYNLLYIVILKSICYTYLFIFDIYFNNRGHTYFITTHSTNMFSNVTNIPFSYNRPQFFII